ncbi:EamA domain containing protein [Trema orientale]|uniref:EamA domain containing protein n=1 Tax=Trema orientale TaxID=63057 RepID=A0A2P5EG37_TREOI|nr:EamA domain containing protein [Trema orientale]
MASAATENGGADHVVQLSVREAPSEIGAGEASESEEISPLLTQAERPKINIFTVSYPRRKPRDQVTRLTEVETSLVTQFALWVWSGSRYSGLLCMALSSTMYFLMGVVSNVFSVQSIPLFETAFTRCTIILISSYMWLRKTGQPIRGLANVRYLLISRALVGYFSLMSFMYCIQRLPLSQAILLSFTTPIMASVMARIILHEKLKIADIGGLACSFFGVLFIFRGVLTTQGGLVNNGEGSNAYTWKSNHIYAILVGLFSAITGGVSYCLIRAGAKASDQPMATVFSFGVLASPAAGICSFALEDFVFPGLYSSVVMLILGVLAFFAEVFLARALQLEKTSKVANVQFMEAALSQLWGIGWLSIAPSFHRLVGCLLIVISVCCTMYIGPDKEAN